MFLDDWTKKESRQFKAGIVLLFFGGIAEKSAIIGVLSLSSLGDGIIPLSPSEIERAFDFNYQRISHETT